jgi:adenylate kinase family enzyme
MDLDRVSVIGTSCSGKTTFARSLAAILDVPHFELDSLYWKPNWSAAPDGEFRASVEKITQAGRWVVDGNYRVANDIVWSRATVVIWLNYPFPLVFYRALRRTIQRVARKELLFAGNRETFRAAFLSRQSILLWVITTHWRRRRQYSKFLRSSSGPWREAIVLRGPRDARRFFRSLKSSAAREHP